MITTVAEAIGDHQPQDWHLNPNSHVQRMTGEAGPPKEYCKAAVFR
jgi:hypothetical protein